MRDAVAENFLAEARGYLLGDYLPKIERCLERLTDEQIWWRAGEQSNSVGNLTLHLAGNARQWVVCGVGGGEDRRVRDAEFAARGGATREELRALLRSTLEEVDAVLARLGPAELQEGRRIQGLDVTVLGAVFHVVEHFSMHTGQIILLTKLLTGTDLAFYSFPGNDARREWER
ncbi:MAG TPA: DinB family protein [Pyrinomonadaceae bacterium]|nr:DinB family protein [Pyrinomonadaceae bacterium]